MGAALEVEQLIASDRPALPVRPVLAAALVLAVAVCGRSATPGVPIARPSAPGRVNLQLISGGFTLRFTDSVSRTRSPWTAAADAQCYWLTASAARMSSEFTRPADAADAGAKARCRHEPPVREQPP
jgi:hypothetical protein